MESKIFVTGADGFIGSHLVEELIRKGKSVKALVQYNSFNSWGWLDRSPPEIRDAIEVVAGDIRDPHGVNRAMKDCDQVIHLASLIAIPYSYHSPASYIETNVSGTLNVLEAARVNGIQRILHTSTSEVYGSAQTVPINESHRLLGQSPYAASKIAADQLAYSYFASFNLPAVIVRPFNTYGPRQSARAVIPSIIIQIASGKRTLKLGALTPTRDFNFVKDTVSGFIAALESEVALGEVVNFGSNYEISIGDTVKTIASVMGVQVEIESDESRMRPSKSEVNRLRADNSKARDLFGWAPHYGGLEGFRSGLEVTVEWFKSAKNLETYKTEGYNI